MQEPPMLFYISLYVLAALLVFQGLQLLGEINGQSINLVPAEVKPTPSPAARWGGFLIAYGGAMAASGLLSHGYEWFQGSLSLLRGFGVAVEAIYGAWLIFGRKVDYTPAPVSAGDAHGHH
jgi:hypothetical protein